MKTRIRIGTRGSHLALWQATFVENLINKLNPEVLLERVIIKTEGDRDQSSSLTQIGGIGIFTKAIEEALLENRIDIAIHSLKDLPSDERENLVLGAVPERGPVEDALVTQSGLTLQQLKPGARIASGSIRRRSQLLNTRPDLKLTDLRGNIETRLNKLRVQNLDGIIMARAALERLKISDIKYHILAVADMIPSPGQGAIGIQIRRDRVDLVDMLSEINHSPSYQAVTSERVFLHQLDSGCQFPVGAHARIKDGKCVIQGFVGSEDGQKVIVEQLSGLADHAEDVGRKLARKFIEKGALNLLKDYNTK